MPRRFVCLTAVSLIVAVPAVITASAQDEVIEVGVVEAPDTESEELVLLPGQGQGLVKTGAKLETPRQPKARLKPGGGLMLSFDADGNGRITLAEVQAGAGAAFAEADANGDGELTALEQQDWAEAMPTRDDTLANPARFDPNLDRRVEAKEFVDVILSLATDYVEESSGEMTLASLEAPKREGREGDPFAEERQRQNRIRRKQDRERQRW